MKKKFVNNKISHNFGLQCMMSHENDDTVGKFFEFIEKKLYIPGAIVLMLVRNIEGGF